MKLEIRDLLDTQQTIAQELFEGYRYPWEVIGSIGGFILELGERLSDDAYEQTDADVWIAKDARVAASACLRGPLIIDHGAEVRHCAFVRGDVIVGRDAVVGNSTELKNCILFDHVQAPHFNYVGDSILGAYAHLGASTVTSNIRCDKKNVVIHADKDICTGMRKMGTVIGDRAEIGCGTVLNPGTIVGRRSIVYPSACVRGVVPEDCICKGMNSIVLREG